MSIEQDMGILASSISGAKDHAALTRVGAEIERLRARNAEHEKRYDAPQWPNEATQEMKEAVYALNLGNNRLGEDDVIDIYDTIRRIVIRSKGKAMKPAREVIGEWGEIYRWDGGDARLEALDDADALLKMLDEAGYQIVPQETKMAFTNDKRQEMLEAAKPLIKWMNENCHPHCKAIVDQIDVRLTEGIACVGTNEFLKD